MKKKRVGGRISTSMTDRTLRRSVGEKPQLEAAFKRGKKKTTKKLGKG